MLNALCVKNYHLESSVFFTNIKDLVYEYGGSLVAPMGTVILTLRSYSSFQYPKGVCKIAGERVFAGGWNSKTRGNDFKQAESRSRTDIREKFFPVWTVRRWGGLQRRALDVHPWQCSKPGWMGL